MKITLVINAAVGNNEHTRWEEWRVSIVLLFCGSGIRVFVGSRDKASISSFLVILSILFVEAVMKTLGGGRRV